MPALIDCTGKTYMEIFREFGDALVDKRITLDQAQNAHFECLIDKIWLVYE